MKIKLSSLPTYYINMEDDTERKSRFLGWNEELGFDNVTRIPGTYSDPYFTGLSQSFASAIKEGLALEDMFIIFEDDAAPTEKFVDEIEIPDDADALYLGVSPWGFSHDQDPKDLPMFNGSVFEEVNGFPNVFKIHSTLSNHAIVYITKAFCESTLASLERALATGQYNDAQKYFDGIFDKHNVYAIGPLFYQHDEKKPPVLAGTRDINMQELLIDKANK
jgi:hypothetical protein